MTFRIIKSCHKRIKRRKKAVFFTIDAFTAVSMMIVGIVIFVAFYFHAPFKTQVFYYSQDISTMFASTKIDELNINNMDHIKNMIRDGSITKMDNTLFQQIAEFYYRAHEVNPHCLYCENSIADFIGDIMNNRISGRFSYSILLYDNPDDYNLDNPSYRYEQKADGESNNNGIQTESSKSNIQMSSKTLVTGQYNNTEFYGPYILEVRVWQ